MIKRENYLNAARKEHMATYKLDIVKENQPRLVWIHQDQAENSEPSN